MATPSAAHVQADASDDGQRDYLVRLQPMVEARA
jgi:hypothetical protein